MACDAHHAQDPPAPCPCDAGRRRHTPAFHIGKAAVACGRRPAARQGLLLASAAACPCGARGMPCGAARHAAHQPRDSSRRRASVYQGATPRIVFLVIPERVMQRRRGSPCGVTGRGHTAPEAEAHVVAKLRPINSGRPLSAAAIAAAQHGFPPVPCPCGVAGMRHTPPMAEAHVPPTTLGLPL